MYKKLTRTYPPKEYEYSLSGDMNKVDPGILGKTMGEMTNLSVKATRKRSHLDHFLTSHPENYQLGVTCPPLGFGSDKVSDHLMVVVKSR